MSTQVQRRSRPTARRLVSTVAMLIVALIGFAGLAQPASASASRCEYSGRPVDRCVYVNGSGLKVNYIDATITFVTGQYLEIEVWGDGIYYRGHGDQGTPSDQAKKRITVNRNLANHSWVCVTGRWTDGTQIQPPACVEIHS
ncbi:hypothetical protein GCM10010172_19040 [Paractinoplanes ferrugineus]|uniref:Uncharacterized protein n=1 Tax=Paractinoplanes ferrugineus TaxID=113564 RepID=A0A919JBA4_9ACTN|nr:hypothetical protein [Actinoplanes ferrugineus]GIE16672.1 hypothetical protein Afe05nite_85120 [Actinoplanes ferrugineus]